MRSLLKQICPGSWMNTRVIYT